MYWEDRIGRAGYEKYEAAILKFRAGKRFPDRDAQQTLYEELEACGIYPEEADEMVNLEVENWGEN